MNTSNLVHKTVRSFKNDGLVETFIKAVRYPFVPHIQRNKEAKIFRHQDIEDRFTQIYELNYWGSRESISGVGSNLSNTENLRTVLPELLIKYEIRSIFDAPCGDFNWMKHVRRQYPMDYTGADIVAPLIQSLNSKYQDQNTRFLHLDLTKHKFPKADLMICRDCLFHLSYEDTKSVLTNFIGAHIPFLLTSTHIHSDEFTNKDIMTGGFRLIDMFSAPYNFPSDVLLRIVDAQEKNKETEMCLWTRKQIIQAITTFS